MSEKNNTEEIRLKVCRTANSNLIRYEISSTINSKVTVTPEFDNVLRKVASLQSRIIEKMNQK